MCLLDPLSEYMHRIEDVMSEVRAQRLAFTSMLKEAVLMSLDQMRTESETMLEATEIQLTSLQTVQQLFVRMKDASPMDAEILAAEVIRELGGEFAEELPIVEKKSDPKEYQQAPQEQQCVSPENENIRKDLLFFRSISQRIDSICPYWDARSGILLEFCLRLNHYLDTPVDATQLSTAVLLHDLGMSFVPREILNKNSKLSPLEEKEIKRHVDVSYEWVFRIPHWQDAAEIIYQHHERPDGNGYPRQLGSEQICNGAKVLALADTFFAITNERADRSYKRSLLRATKEINSYAGSQFDMDTVLAFNQMIKDQYSKKSTSTS
ncbi:hypothetical protein A9Q99_14815 [Gammaproteobacteria bacterium 45_16_T64]|nr:hypothetical protein A9Q99_14815 [Gammaproteobacteria bacterium 45_16_T64]